jgi:predicted GTPase
MMKEQAQRPALDVLRMLFNDQPDLLRIVTSRDLASQQLLVELRQRDDLLGAPVKQYVVGRTGAGKTSLGNRLFGAEVMSVRPDDFIPQP